MIVKKIQVPDMQVALASISKEYGSEAVILSSKKTKKKGFLGLFTKPYYEVMVAYEPDKTPEALKIKALRERLIETAKKQTSIEEPEPVLGGSVNVQADDAAEAGFYSQRQAEAPDPEPEVKPYEFRQILTGKAEPEIKPFNPPQIISGTYTRASVNMQTAALTTSRPDSDESAETLEALPEPAVQAASEAEFEIEIKKDEDSRIDELGQRLDILTSAIESIMAKVEEIQVDPASKKNLPSALEEMTEILIANQVDPSIAYELAAQAGKLLDRVGENGSELSKYLRESGDAQKEKSEKTPQQAREALYAVAGDCIGRPKPLKLSAKKRKIVLFLGATGVGKTTTLVKLAAMFIGKDSQKKVGIINTDTFRAGAQKQLEVYSDLLDLPLCVAYEPEDITQALMELKGCDLVLIDTAGKRPGEQAHVEYVKKLVEHSKADEIYLTISATTSYPASRHIIDNYGFLKNYKLLITKIDEAGKYGNILNLCHYSKMPLTYISTGQNVPEDIEVAKKQEILEKILGAVEAEG